MERSNDIQAAGLLYRRDFLRLLLAATVLRFTGCTLLLTIEFQKSNYWLFLLSAQLPSLLFFSTFSLFIYFFAKLVHWQERDRTMSILKPIYLMFNLFTYLAFSAIAVYFEPDLYFSNATFLRALCGLYGMIYLVFSACMTNYGGKLIGYLGKLY